MEIFSTVINIFVFFQTNIAMVIQLRKYNGRFLQNKNVVSNSDPSPLYNATLDLALYAILICIILVRAMCMRCTELSVHY